MFRKLGIVTAGVVVIVALGSPAVSAAGNPRKATVLHTTTSGGVTFALTGDAREVSTTTSPFSTVTATCTIVGGENADPNAQVVPDCYVRDITYGYSNYLSTTWMYSGHGSAAGTFEFHKGHELELCVGAHTTPMLGQGWGVAVEAPCERLR